MVISTTEKRAREGWEMFFINTLGKEDLTEKETTEHLKVLGSRLVYIWGKSTADRRQSMCKGPETGAYLARLKKSEKASIAGAA